MQMDEIRTRFFAMRSTEDAMALRADVEAMAATSTAASPGDLTAGQLAVLTMLGATADLPEGMGMGHKSLSKFFGRCVAADLARLRELGMIDGGPLLN
jgi:hypothetical protein